MDAKPYKISHPFRKLNKELIDTMVKDISEGSTQRLAAESNGITERIFYVWIAQGKIDIEVQNESLCSYFVQSLAQVQQREVKMCRNAILSSEKGHKGAEWSLEHAHARDFSGNAVVQEFMHEINELKGQLAKGNSNGEVESSEAE